MNRSKMLVAIFLGLAAFVIVLIWLTQRHAADQPKVTNFEECAKAGYKVRDFYPRQCDGPGGRVFVEEKI